MTAMDPGLEHGGTRSQDEGVAPRRLRRMGLLGVTSKASTWYWLAKTRLYFKPQFAALGEGSVIRNPLLIRNPAGISIGRDVSIRDGARLEIIDRQGLPGGRLSIGDGVNIEQDVHIAACDDVVIEDLVCFAARCAIVDTNHPANTEGNRASAVSSERSFVRIGRRVFLGVGVVVLPNVTIGENSIIGANSVVAKDIPPNSVAVGAPARVIRTLAAPASGETSENRG
ncbi:acyltransferase [uncultured Amnibacterium sp.]|uniref:acyltransferase n=1 Tax=uncultured Amnibacterium sp. TaxID=1631851 RepID=UPI0035CAF2B6